MRSSDLKAWSRSYSPSPSWVELGDLNPPPQLPELQHLSGNDGPNLKDRRKAAIEQTHFAKLTQPIN